jgi:hypothetical protein
VAKTKLLKSGEVKVLKIDRDLGLVIGWGAVCTEDGEPYFDRQGDTFPEEEMLKSTLDFMRNSRGLDAMHQEQRVGEVVFGFPMTSEVMEALGVEGSRTGFIVGVCPDRETLAKFESGEYKAFSIGGWYRREPVGR